MVIVLQVIINVQLTSSNSLYPGTVVFLQPEQTLVFKVDVGWRYIVVCRYYFLL